MIRLFVSAETYCIKYMYSVESDVFNLIINQPISTNRHNRMAVTK